VRGNLTDRAIEKLSQLPSLRLLNVSGYITPSGIMHLENSRIEDASITTPCVNNSNAASLREYDGSANVHVYTPWLLPNETLQYEPIGHNRLKLVSCSHAATFDAAGEPLDFHSGSLEFESVEWKQLLQWPTITCMDLVSFEELPASEIEQLHDLSTLFFVGSGCSASYLERLCIIRNLKFVGIISTSIPGIRYEMFDGNSVIDFKGPWGDSMAIVMNRTGAPTAEPPTPLMVINGLGSTPTAYNMLSTSGIFDACDQLMSLQDGPSLSLLNATAETDLSCLRDAEQIRVLQLVNCALSDEQWQLVWQLPRLERLNIQRCALYSVRGSSALDGIENLKTLKKLEIGTFAPLIWPTDRSINSPLVEWIEMNDADTILAPIGLLENLEELSIQVSSFEGKALHDFSQLKNLRILDIAMSKVRDEYIAELRNLPNLEELNLSGTEVTDAIVDVLAELPKLRECGLDFTSVSSEEFARLVKLLDQRPEP
jgi:hypothetical protein